MKRLLITAAAVAGAVAALLIALLLALPLLVDANAYKARIADLVEARTGRALTIAGDIEVSTFPALAAELSGLALAHAAAHGGTGAGTHFAEIDRVRAAVRLLPLLAGRVELDRLRIDGLRLELARDAAGGVNWADLVAHDAGRGAREGARAGLGGLALAGIEVRDAALRWVDHAAGETLLVSALTLRTGRLRAGVPVEVDAHFELSDAHRGLSSDNRLGLALSIAEDLSAIDASRLALESSVRGERLPGAALALEAHGDARLDLRARRLTSAGIDVAVRGPWHVDVHAALEGDLLGARYLLSGFAAEARLPRDATGSARLVLRSDAPIAVDLAAESLNAGTLTADLDASGIAGLDGRLRASGALAGDLARQRYAWTGIDGRGELAPAGARDRSVPVELGAEVVLDTRAGTLALDDLRLALDGADISARAEVGGLAGTVHARGRLVGERLEPRRLLAALGIEAASPADAAALRSARASAEFAYDGERLALSPLSLEIDGARVEGDIALVAGERASIEADLHASRIDLDPYLALGGSGSSDGAGVIALALARLRELDVEGKLGVDALTVAGSTFERAHASVHAHDGSVRVEPLEARLDGARLSAAVRVDVRDDGALIVVEQRMNGVRADRLLATLGIAGGALAPRGASDLTLAATLATDADALRFRIDPIVLDARLADASYPGGMLEAALRGAADLDLVAGTLRSDSLRLTIGEALVSARGTLQGLGTAPRLRGEIEASGIDARALAAALLRAPMASADASALARAAFSAEVSASADAIALENLALTLDESHLRGALSIRPGNPPGVRFDLALDALELDRYLPPAPAASRTAPAKALAFPLTALADLTVDGDVRIGTLEVNDVALHDVRMVVRTQDGALRIVPRDLLLGRLAAEHAR